MKIVSLAVVASTLIAVGGAASAAEPFDRGDGRFAAEESLPLEPAQYYWGGRPYCWYFEGWRGPGWYRCGNPWRQGYGWGGGHGWRGWDVPGWRGERYGRPRERGEHGRDWDDRGRGRRDGGDDDRGRRGNWQDGDRNEWRGRGDGRRGD